MTVDPHTLAAQAEKLPRSQTKAEKALIVMFRRIVLPLYDAWLEANPPCVTCGGSGLIATDESDGIYCPACPDHPGRQSFTDWCVKRLLATYNAVHDDDRPIQGDAFDYRYYLRQIGGTR